VKPINLKVVEQGQAAYEAVESYAKKRYQEIHCARPARVNPILLVAYRDTAVVGCLGISPAESGPLLAETYLDVPITEFLGTLGLERVRRHELVEVGSLAAENGRVALSLLTQAPHFLQDGYSYAILTATRLVRRLIRCAGIVTRELALAHKQSLPSSQRRGWGRYYDDDPRVLLVDLAWVPALEVRRAS
jgi:hypothetical protein